MNSRIEHTNLRVNATSADIVSLIDEAITHQLRSVCVAPTFVLASKTILGATDIRVVTVVGFPSGAHRCDTKVLEAMTAEQDGADELDVVMDIGAFIGKEYLWVEIELAKIVRAVKIPVKVIVEEPLLSDTDLLSAYQIVEQSGAYCIKSGTGTQGPARLETIALWSGMSDLKIKAAGGIRTAQQAQNFVIAGATYIGTSHGVAIMKEMHNETD